METDRRCARGVCPPKGRTLGGGEAYSRLRAASCVAPPPQCRTRTAGAGTASQDPEAGRPGAWRASRAAAEGGRGSGGDTGAPKPPCKLMFKSSKSFGPLITRRAGGVEAQGRRESFGEGSQSGRVHFSMNFFVELTATHAAFRRWQGRETAGMQSVALHSGRKPEMWRFSSRHARLSRAPSSTSRAPHPSARPAARRRAR